MRKHKGINQKTGKLKKGYKYSGKKLKSGLPQIVRSKSIKKNKHLGAGRRERESIITAYRGERNIAKIIDEYNTVKYYLPITTDYRYRQGEVNVIEKHNLRSYLKSIYSKEDYSEYLSHNNNLKINNIDKVSLKKLIKLVTKIGNKIVEDQFGWGLREVKKIKPYKKYIVEMGRYGDYDIYQTEQDSRIPTAHIIDEDSDDSEDYYENDDYTNVTNVNL